MSAIIEERSASLPDADATIAAGERMAPELVGGMVVTLSGDLGAGKTTLVRGMLRGLGWAGAVKSPTYALVEHYVFSSLYFYHFDFYRFGDPDEWDSSGFAEYFRPDCDLRDRVAGKGRVAAARGRPRADARNRWRRPHTAPRGADAGG